MLLPKMHSEEQMKEQEGDLDLTCVKKVKPKKIKSRVRFPASLGPVLEWFGGPRGCGVRRLRSDLNGGDRLSKRILVN